LRVRVRRRFRRRVRLRGEQGVRDHFGDGASLGRV
jgi:hypothetical protein